jgi:hypothetical protein
MAKKIKKEEREFASAGGRSGEDPTYGALIHDSKGLRAAIGDDPKQPDMKQRRKALKLARKLGLQRRTT